MVRIGYGGINTTSRPAPQLAGCKTQLHIAFTNIGEAFGTFLVQ